MRVSGHYSTGGAPAGAEEISVTGGLSVFFGGLEFRIAGEENGGGFLSADPEAPKSAALPEKMIISGDTVLLRLSGGGELSFAGDEGGTELRIRGDFPPDIEGLLLFYTPLKTSHVQNRENDLPLIIAEGRNYSFDRSAQEKGQSLLFLENGGIPVSYGVIPEKPAFNPEDYTLSEALDRQSYNAALRSWRDRQYSLWTRLVQGRNDEELILAFLDEAIGRGGYQSAKSLIPPAFLNGNQRGYGSSPYLGGIARTYPALSTANRERLDRLSRLIDEGSPAILGEDHPFEYLALRDRGDLVERAAELVRNIDPLTLDPGLVPGIFEGFLDTRQRGLPGENPFGDLTEDALLLVSQQLARVSGDWNSGQGLVLTFGNEIGDSESNLRLGNSLALWAEETGDAAWAALGRSLVLSVLSLADQEGSVPAQIPLAGPAAPGEGLQRLDSSRIYRILRPGGYYPRIASLGIESLWAWTSSPSVSAVRENGVLDISISFPAGETHYLMLWGIQPFTRMQIHSMDWRSDPRYESYDSSGWVYYPRDQLLALKLKHRVPVEHIRIYSSQPAPAPANPAPAP
jgi:hypothetical protein